MSKTTVRWITGQQFIGIDSTNHSVVLSTPSEGIGMKPSDLLLVALSSCIAVDVVEIIAKKRMQLESLEIAADGQQDQDPPWTFRAIDLLFTLRGKGLVEKDIAQAIELAENKYCSVGATIRGTAQITTRFVINPDQA
jgi:putative redox protein